MGIYKLTAMLLASAVTLTGCFHTTGGDDQDYEDDQGYEQDSDNMMDDDKDGSAMDDGQAMTYDYTGSLEDVSGGSSSGVAQASFKDGKYMMLATFTDLPDPTGTDFYEGWVVRKGENMDVISSGKAEKVNGVYTNSFMSNLDLTDHTFYVLTLEPDDGDPAPAAHILEGTMAQQ